MWIRQRRVLLSGDTAGQVSQAKRLWGLEASQSVSSRDRGRREREAQGCKAKSMEGCHMVPHGEPDCKVLPIAKSTRAIELA